MLAMRRKSATKAPSGNTKESEEISGERFIRKDLLQGLLTSCSKQKKKKKTFNSTKSMQMQENFKGK